MKKILIAALVLAMCLCLCACKSSDYSEAMEQYAAGEYQQAKDTFAVLGDYENSVQMVQKCDYQMAKEQLEAGEYQQAKDIFAALGEYEDAPQLVQKCTYQIALRLMEEEQYTEALAQFQTLGDYEDSAERSVGCICAMAKAAAEGGKLKEAVAILVDYYADPQAKEAFFTILLEEATNNYLPNVEAAQETWNEYLLVWMKAVKASADKTAVGKSIDIPKVDHSAPQVISLQRSMEKANKSIALLREAYNEEVLQVCEEDIRNLVASIFTAAETIDNQFKNLDNWAVTTLFYGIQDNNASKANNKLINALYSIEDALEVVMDNRK